MRLDGRSVRRRVIAPGLVALVVVACGSPAASGSPTAALPDVPLPELIAGGDPWGPWQPQPIPVNAAVRVAAERACRASMQPFPAAPLVVVDARGEGLLQAQFANATGEATCMDMILNRDGSVLAMGGGSTMIGAEPAPAMPPFAIDSRGSMQSGGRDEIVRSVASGRVGQGIASVVIDVPGAGRITASVANGWYVAWYPGDWPPGTTVRGLDISGSSVAEATP